MPSPYEGELMPQGFELPKLPNLQDTLGPGKFKANQGTIYDLLQAPQARMTDALPGLRDLLMGSQGGAISAIREGARSNEAAAQSDAMRRGLTGSDIELANMRGARESGVMQEGQLMGQQSQALAQYVMQAMGMDITSNREMFMTLAQAIGQQLAQQQEMQLAKMGMAQAAAEAARNRKSSLFGAGIGAIGSIGGGALAGLLSDRRLKTDIQPVSVVGGIGIFRYKWNDTAKEKFGLEGSGVGVMAQDIEAVRPDLVLEGPEFKSVNYTRLPPAVQLAILEAYNA